MKPSFPWRYHLQKLLVVALVLFLTGCFSVQLVSDYDEKFDEALTELQKKTIRFLAKLERTCETPAGEYRHHEDWYDGVKTDVAVLQSRAEAKALNRLTAEQIRLLGESFSRMQAQHRKGFSPLVVASTRELLNSQFTSIFKLELGKKRTN